jgi:hypothetical protein
MKKIFTLFLFINLIGLSGILNAQIPTDGLVGYWPFNANANDESGNGHDGTVNGATLTTDRFGNQNSAYSFDGVNDDILTTFVGILGNTSRTISAWVKTETLNDFGTIVTYGSVTSANGGTDRFMCELRNDGIEGVSLDIDGSRMTYASDVTSSNWHFYTWVFDNTISNSVSDIKIYVDGVKLTDLAESYIPFPAAGIINTISDEPVRFASMNSTEYFNGSLDDIRIYNRALTETEIGDLYYEDSNGLIAHYPFNGNANDESGLGNHGTVNGAALTTDRFGNENSAYLFDGVNDYINVLHSTSLDIVNDEITISAWAKGNGEILEKGDLDNRKYGIFVGNPPTFGFELKNEPGTSYHEILQGIVDTSVWSHFVAYYDGTVMKCYINNTMVGSYNTTGNIISNSRDLIIGAFGDLIQAFFKGKIDDIRIYNRALTETEISDLYHEGGWDSLNQGLVAHYPFNGNANDESGNGNHGIVSGATLTTDRFGSANSAYSFDGVSFIHCTSSTSLQFPDDITVCAWVKANNPTNGVWSTAVGKYDSGPNDSGWELYLVNNGEAYFGGRDHSGSQINSNASTTNIINNNWNFLVGKREGSIWKIYVNGVLESQNDVGTFGSLSNTVDLRINAGYYSGLIDDISIYNRALTETEISDLYHEGGWDPLSNGLMAHYPFNGNANDESGNGHDGTVNGATLTTDRFGNENSAYEFDGNTNFIEVPSSSSLILSDNYSLAVWVKRNGSSFVGTGEEIIAKAVVNCDAELSLRPNNTAVLAKQSCENIVSSTVFDMNNWNFIVVTYSSTDAKMYLNGQLNNSITTSAFGNTLSDILFGKSCTNNAYFSGKIDDISIYNRALTDSEINLLYHEGDPNNSNCNYIGNSQSWLGVSDITGATNIIDNDQNTFGSVTMSNYSTLYTKYAEINFPETKSISSFKFKYAFPNTVQSPCHGYPGGIYHTCKVKLFYKDGVNWVEAYLVTENLNTSADPSICQVIDSAEFVFDQAISAKDWKIEMLGNYWLGGAYQTTTYFNLYEAGFMECTEFSSDMVAHYPFNGNANDESGNGNHGTVDGATLTTDRFGNENSAYMFDGNDKIVVADAAAFNFNSSSEFTISVWAMKTTSSNVFHILGKRIDCTGYQYQIGSNTSPYGISFGGVNGTTDSYIETGLYLDINNWYNLVGTYNGTEWNFYINKNKVGTLVSDMPPAVTADLLFGTSGTCESFIGKIDDISIYNRALTEAEILDLYSEGAPEIITQPADQNVCSGDSVSFIVESGPGHSYQWQKNNEDIIGANDTIYTIMTVDETDAGDYTCEVSNTFNSTVSNVANLYVRPSYLQTETVSVCSGENYTFPDGTTQNNITSQVVHLSSLQTVLGCDSIIETTVDVHPVYDLTENVYVCSGENYTFPDGTVQNNITAQVVYVSSLQTVFGCDSIIETTVDVHPVYDLTENVFVCSGENYTFPDGTTQNNITAQVVYVSNLQTVFGCDSIIETTVDVHPVYDLTENVFVCSGESYTFPDGTTQNNITSQVVHLSSLQTVLGCDSLIETTVNVNPGYDLTETVSVCSGESYTFPDGFTQNNIGTQAVHTSYLQTEFGCDSIITTTVNVYQINITLTKTDAGCNNPTGTAIANVTGDNAPFGYLWSNGSTDYYANGLSAGTHFVQVTDNQGCYADQFFTISSSEGPEIAHQSITDIQCYGGNTGAIDITVTGGTQPYIYEWSTGHAGQDISGMPAGMYAVTISDAGGCVTNAEYEIEQADAITVDTDIINPTCTGSEGQITANVSGGTAPYTYLWSIGASTPQITNLAAGTYHLTVSDNAGCSSYISVNLSDTGAPEIVLESVENTSCGNNDGAIDVTITGGTLPYASIDWSNGTHEEDLTGVGVGVYTLTVTDNAGCLSNLTAEVLSETAAVQSICMVTVDSISGRNLIVWEKPVSNNIDHFTLYRESNYAGQYLPIADIDYDALSEYIDLDANPATRSWRYKLSATDVCDAESSISDHHKTMHLTMNEGIDQSINLIWDHYEGFTFGTYRIYRWLNSSGWIVLDEMPSNLTSYTDYPPSMGGLYYKIAVLNENPCTSSKSGTYDEAVSNMKGFASTIGIDQGQVTNTVSVYPNPSEGFVTIKGTYIQKVEVMNIHGQMIHRQEVNFTETEMNLGKLAKGVYFLKIYGEGVMLNEKLILK